MNILVFAGSNSSTSINRKLATYVSGYFKDETIQILDINDYEVAIFSVDREMKTGIPDLIKDFVAKIEWADLLIISLAEHNGAYTAAFKNIMDWSSRLEGKFFKNRSLFLLSTSTGARGGKSVMDLALVRFPIHGANILEHFSFPEFQKNFNVESGIINSDLKKSLETLVSSVKEKIVETLNEINL